jgi:hypothetical protein
MSDKPDNLPRFGFCYDLDAEPQIIHERPIAKIPARPRAVVVIPLPFMSAKQKAKVRAFTKSLHP